MIYHMLPVMTCCPNIGLKARVKQLSTEPPQTWKTSYINCTGAENADENEMECLPSMQKALVLPILHTLSVVVHACNPNTHR